MSNINGTRDQAVEELEARLKTALATSRGWMNEAKRLEALADGLEQGALFLRQENDLLCVDVRGLERDVRRLEAENTLLRERLNEYEG